MGSLLLSWAAKTLGDPSGGCYEICPRKAPVPRSNLLGDIYFQPQILIWAGSSSVGLDAIHLAKLAGYPVVTTASPHNHALLKSLGADAMFDYKDPDVSEKIMEWCETEGYGRDGISIVLDTISTAGSTMLAAKALGASGGRIITLRECGRFVRRRCPKNPPTDILKCFSSQQPQG